MCYTATKVVIPVKKKKPLKIILIVLGVLLSPILLLILGWLFFAAVFFAMDAQTTRQGRQETFAHFEEHRESLEQTVFGFEKFPCAQKTFFTMTETYGYFYSPTDTYDDYFDREPERHKKGYATKYSDCGIDYNYYAEKICDNWYYYEESYNY